MLLSMATYVSGQQNIWLSGKVLNEHNEALAGATIQVNNTGVISKANGEFRLKLNKAKYALQVSYVGYATLHDTVMLSHDTTITLILKALVVTSDEIVIKANRNRLTTSVEPGVVKLTGKDLQRLPALFGEPDIMHAIKILPGVQAAGDGNAGFYVRGGSADQNGILLDNFTVFNPSHVLGFISVFNSDIIEQTSVIKSGMPAYYGGRLSSVVDIKTITGSMNQPSVNINTGLISSKASITVPVIKKRMSAVVSFRRSYLDEVLKPAFQLVNKNNNSIFNNSAYYFYDVNARLSLKINPTNYASVHYYKGADNFSLKQNGFEFQNSMQWGNTILGLNTYHALKGGGHIKNSVYSTNYNFGFYAQQNNVTAKLYSGIHEFGLKSIASFSIGNTEIKTGIDEFFRLIYPNNVDASARNVVLDFGSNRLYQSNEFAAYMNAVTTLTKKLSISYGLRYTNYLHLGPYTHINQPESDTSEYTYGSVVKAYNMVEPRFSVKYSLSPNVALKGSYTRNNQFIHQAPTANVTLPVDVWVTSTKAIRPQLANHFSLGVFADVGADFKSSLDFYYKKMFQLIELTSGLIDNFRSDNIDENIATGQGWSYGAEYYTEWTPPGRHSAVSSITLSRTFRQFNNFKAGRVYPAKHDRIIDMKLSYTYRASKRTYFNMLFVFATGEALTLPNGWALIHENLIVNPGIKNDFRMPAYHRLDVSVTRTLKAREDRESQLVFSVFNVYNRANPFYIYFDTDQQPDEIISIKAKQVSLFPVLPTLAWRYSF